MAMEPIGSVMTYGAQQSVQPVRTVETTEGQSQQTNVMVNDPQTVAVSKVNENPSGQESGNESQSNFDEEAMRRAVKEMNKKSENVESQFGIHEKTNRITIKIVDKKTKEVIKELPPEKTLDMIAKVWEMAGMFVDEKR